MANKRKSRKVKKTKEKKASGLEIFSLPPEIKRWIGAVVMFLTAIIIALSFFEKAGAAGSFFMKIFTFVAGKAVFMMPFLFVLGALALVKSSPSKSRAAPILLAIFLFTLGIAGFLHSLNADNMPGGWLGYVVSGPVLSVFDALVARIIFASVVLVSCLIFLYFLRISWPRAKKTSEPIFTVAPEKSVIRKVFSPKFKIKEVEPAKSLPEKEMASALDQKEKLQPATLDAALPAAKAAIARYQDYPLPPVSLLEGDTEVPTSGDIKINSAIIKRTLQNFDIPVEMSEVNIGPTVTQYTLKPAEGVKLSRITALNQDLSLALAAHPLRVEAPIPGRPLVGVEVPNKVRAQVRLKDIIEHEVFQNSSSRLPLALGRDVAGTPFFADLARMPHFLVAGSTGTGKTICLNNIILSLLYKNTPSLLKFILVDPKRVEFSAYNDLPHLLTPVIYDAQKAVNALKWLISEMERRFEVFSAEKAKDTANFNQLMVEQNKEPIPYIVLIIDELADLMAARGREVEAGIVRLAQMARAVGIHLVVATQRPSVEVITGLIKANITSRITFQVASQVDSRTVLDTAGAEKLLGRGDMLFVSSEVSKPKRIQGAYLSDKEIKKVISYIKKQVSGKPSLKIETADISDSLAKTLETDSFDEFSESDPLYEEAKRVVTEYKKASASLLQRRLRVGYARAARLIDILEEKGVVGPGEGAKPREVYTEEGEV